MVPGLKQTSELKRFAPEEPKVRKGDRMTTSASVEVMSTQKPRIPSPVRKDPILVAK